jgi:hypothetical protein
MLWIRYHRRIRAQTFQQVTFGTFGSSEELSDWKRVLIPFQNSSLSRSEHHRLEWIGFIFVSKGYLFTLAHLQREAMSKKEKITSITSL